VELLDLIFPRKCLTCGKSGSYLCSDCINKVPFSKQICIYCQKPSIDGFTHLKCKNGLRIDGSTSIWSYKGVLRTAILKIKYKFIYAIGSELSYYVSSYLKENVSALSKNCILTPIPLHWIRENWRGFNQSEKIGRIIAEKMGWKFIPDLMIRKQLTKPQVELKGEDRRKNLIGVFVLNPKYLSLITSNLSLVVFDDVWTTGATLIEAGNMLKRAGAKKVWGLSICK